MKLVAGRLAERERESLELVLFVLRWIGSSSTLLKLVQLRLPDVEKTYADLALQHRARYKQRSVSSRPHQRPACQQWAVVAVR